MIANVRFVCRTSKSLVGEVAQNNFLFALSGQEYPLFAEICSYGLWVWEASDVSPLRKFGTVGRNHYICRVNCVHPYFSVALPLDEMGRIWRVKRRSTTHILGPTPAVFLLFLSQNIISPGAGSCAEQARPQRPFNHKTPPCQKPSSPTPHCAVFRPAVVVAPSSNSTCRTI